MSDFRKFGPPGLKSVDNPKPIERRVPIQFRMPFANSKPVERPTSNEGSGGPPWRKGATPGGKGGLPNEIKTPNTPTENKNVEVESKEPDQTELPQNEEIDWRELLRISEQRKAEMWASLPQACMNFYIEDPVVAAFSPEEVKQIREQNNNTTVHYFNKSIDKPILNPVVTFEQCFEPYPKILEEIRKQGFTKPSPIQAQAWPILLSGLDLIGIAQTGTGKTLAFMLPALIHIAGQTNNKNVNGPTVLVLAPTRELALQIEKEVAKYDYEGIKAVCVYGGGSRRDQINHIKKGIEVVIATPGRLIDIVNAKHIDLKYVTYLVLDEADRMLDMGFEPQIRKLLLDIRPQRQTVMTSATWRSGCTTIAEKYMQDPIQITVGSLDLAAVHSVTQEIIIMDEDDKMDTVHQFARGLKPNEKAIIFCGRKTMADHLSSEFVLSGIKCDCIHGDREQDDREQAIRDIQTGYIPILIATDVASRGLDIDDITHVLNYDFPRNIEEYVHRVGRTGRAGKYGTAITYFTRDDWAQAAELIKILEEANQTVPPELCDMADRFAANLRKRQERRESEKRDARDWTSDTRSLRGNNMGFNNRGGSREFNNSRGGSGGYENNRGGYTSGFINNRGGYGGFNNSRGGSGGFENNRGGYTSGFNNNRGGSRGFSNDRGGFRGSRGSNYNRRGGGASDFW